MAATTMLVGAHMMTTAYAIIVSSLDGGIGGCSNSSGGGAGYRGYGGVAGWWTSELSSAWRWIGSWTDWIILCVFECYSVVWIISPLKKFKGFSGIEAADRSLDQRMLR
jgi:hypothetical protein